jgi:shikimate kinase
VKAAERVILMAVLVVGPSGVGKSSALHYAAQSLGKCRFASLDDLARDLGRERGLIGGSEGVITLRQQLGDDDQFLRLGIDAVERLERQDGGFLIVDVGAGFLDAPTVGAWLRHRTSVALLAPCEVVHRRIVQARADQRSLTEYAAQEYSERRRALYAHAIYTVNADCTLTELGVRFLKLLVGLVNQPC